MIRLLAFVLLLLCGCSAKKGVLKDLDTAQGYAQTIQDEAKAGNAELNAALPDIKSTPAKVRVKQAQGHLDTIDETAGQAKGLLGATAVTVEEDLKDKRTFPWWVKFLVLPGAALLLLSVGLPLLGSLGIPFAVQGAAWMADKGFGFGAKLADQIRLLVKGEGDTPAEVAMDRMAAAARATPLGNEIYKRARKTEILKNA